MTDHDYDPGEDGRGCYAMAVKELRRKLVGPKPPRISEDALHRQVADYLTDALLCPWTTIGHGGGGKVRGAQLKARGVRAGWPDIEIVAPPAGQAVYLELKAAKGVLSDEQKALHPVLRAAGAIVVVCRTLDEVREAVQRHGLPSRETQNAKTRRGAAGS